MIFLFSRTWSMPWPFTCNLKVIAAITVSLVLAISVFSKWDVVHSNRCDFPAVFNFGDSNSDTGGYSAALHRLAYPNGCSFFHKPSGRYCDGRIVIDFIAEKLGFHYLSAYVDSIGANFKKGANFATGGSTIQPLDAGLCAAGFSPFSLDIQVSQFEQFRARVLEMFDQDKSSYVRNRLPRPEDFSKALFTLDIGQNDLHAGFYSMTEKEVVASLPDIVELFAQAIEKLYELGGRIFWIHNTGPFGCIPYVVKHSPSRPGNVDENGCVKSRNEVVQEFNRQLKDRVSQLRKQLADAVFTYVDIYTAKYSINSEAKKLGFGDPLGYCCGRYADDGVPCWVKMVVNGTEVPGHVCSDPKLYISWDGMHYSEAANQRVAHMILDGSLSDPPIPIDQACRKPVQL